jgi:four helix bundle protein
MTNDQIPMANQENAPPIQRAFDLAERTALFGEEVIRFCGSIRRDAVLMPLIRQLVRSATSIGANYVEADEARSEKREKHNIGCG